MTPLLLLLLVAPPTAAPPPPAAGAGGETIVVTGTRLSETEKALRDCLARHCPPDEDIRATLAHAENLFVAGRYRDARGVTKASIGRNHRFRKDYPLPVSDLYRANGRIAAHLGEGADYELSTGIMRGVLDDAFGKSDAKVLMADVEWADMYASMGRLIRARELYGSVAARAAAAGRPDLAGIARVRSAYTYELGGDTAVAQRELRKIAADTSPAGNVGRLSALILLARLDRKHGDPASSDALVEVMRGLHSRRPVLIYAPALDLAHGLATGDDAGGQSMSAVRMMAGNNFTDRWVDIGFWVTPQGKVSDAEVLRSHGSLDWAKPLLRQIAGRIYTPSDDPGGSYRIERYTYTARWMRDTTGSHLRQRSPNVQIEYLDLTSDAPAAAPGPPPQPH
ncbi:MAG: hypothetical protein JO013_12705 [Alphaproteobacteria bacterium]|nr:hypothetical protein [Alphaproteobacteria bacterium]